MTANVHTLLRTFLVAALPTFSVWAGVNFPPDGYKPEDGPGLAFRTRGGAETEENALLIPSCQFKAYGTNPTDAWANYLALDAAISGPSDTSIAWAIQEGMGVPLMEPDSGWDFVLAYYQVYVRNT